MQSINTNNVQCALWRISKELEHSYDVTETNSRNGKVTMFNEPFGTGYRFPTQRVIFWERRDAHPFFHFFESLWMIAGRNDVAYVTKFLKNIAQYSDDGVIFHGAYGHRWRNHFDFDQLETIINQLRKNPEDRRCVLQMWDARVDLGKTGMDLPCNTQATFSRQPDGRLHMTVFNRSNDIVWGAYGANAVHFSYLLEYVASSVGCEVGTYTQFSSNFHVYENSYPKIKGLHNEWLYDPYVDGIVEPFPLMSVDKVQWDLDLSNLLSFGLDSKTIVKDPFFKDVAIPLLATWEAYKSVGVDGALIELENCKATDWKLAVEQWLKRRVK